MKSMTGLALFFAGLGLTLLLGARPARGAEAEPPAGEAICTPQVYREAPGQCPPFGPGAYLEKLAAQGITLPLRLWSWGGIGTCNPPLVFARRAAPAAFEEFEDGDHLFGIAVRPEPVCPLLAGIVPGNGDHPPRKIVKNFFPGRRQEFVLAPGGKLVFVAVGRVQIGETVIRPLFPALAHERAFQPVRAVHAAVEGLAFLQPRGFQ